MALQPKTQGYMLIALESQNIDECAFLIKTLRRQGDTRPMSLIIFQKDKAYCESLALFDQCIIFDSTIENNQYIWSKCTTDFEKHYLFPRLFFNTCLVYDETIVVDSDVLCQASPDPIWKRMSLSPNPIVTIGNKNNPDWHWGYIDQISKMMGKTVPETHSGFFYFRRGDLMLDEFFKSCIDIFFNYEKLGCQLMFRGGKTDEVIFAIANAKFNIDPIEFSEFPIMTFNYTPDMQIPSRVQTERGLNIHMNDYIPFVHMFDKMGGDHFQHLYRRIMMPSTNKTIWLLWLQGWDSNIPYLIRRVSDSWIHNNPEYKVNHVSIANLKDYLDGPELEYMSKVKTPQALSDIIRLSLLAKYGGVWADATMLCMQPLSSWADEKLAPSKIWMYHGQGGKMHTLCGPSSWFILTSHANHEIIVKWKQACDVFWQSRTSGDLSSEEYFWMDGLFKSLYHSDMSFKTLWDKVPFIDCDKPMQAHYLAFNDDMIKSTDAIKENLKKNPPYALKLSRYWDSIFPNPESEQAKQSNAYYAMELAMSSSLHHTISSSPNQLAIQYVVAKYKEDISWTKSLTNVIIYDKDPTSKITETATTTTVTTHRLNNVGREAHTYIHHILSNWDNLATVTVFLQGTPTDHIEGYGSIERFLQVILPPAYQIGLSQNWHIDTFHAPRHAPEVDIDPKNNNVETFFKKHTGTPFHERIKWYGAAQFALRSDIIKKVPKEKWIELKETLEFSSNPITAHFLERLWYELLSKEPAPLSPNPTSNPTLVRKPSMRNNYIL